MKDFLFFIYNKENMQEKSKNWRNINSIKSRISFPNLFRYKYLLIINIFILTLSIKKRQIYSKDSFITLKIQKSGKAYIYFDFNHAEYQCLDEPDKVDEIVINGVKQNQTKSNYDFNQENNNIKLIFKESIKAAGCLFVECSDINEIDLSNFDSSQVTDIGAMFHGCTSLTSINFKNFKTSNVESMDDMFSDCISLTSLDLSSFYTPKIHIVENMFSNCLSLKYINFENAEFQSANFTDNIFKEISDELIICTKDITLISLLKGVSVYVNCIDNFYQITQHECYQKNNSLYYNKYLSDICGSNYYQTGQYLYSGKIYYNYTETANGYYLDKNEEHPEPKECYSKCKLCSKAGNDENNNCIECKDNFYISEINGTNYINCLDNCYYYFYTEILNNKKFCTQNESCPNNYTKLKIDNNECIENCPNATHYEEENKCYPKYSPTTEEFTDMITINKLIFSTNTITNKDILENEFTQNEINIIISDFEDNKVIENEVNISNNLSNHTINNFVSETMFSFENKNIFDSNILTRNINQSEFDNIKDKILKTYNLTYILEGNDIVIRFYKNNSIILSTTKNQKYNPNTSKTSINLKECEDIIKNEYKISLNDTLFILKLEITEEGMKIPKIEYELYYPLYDGEELIQLDLTKCKNNKIDIIYFVDINIKNIDIDKYNKSSNYYNDLCTKSDSERKMDLSLSDRRNEFVDNNMTLCEEDCDLIEYNSTNNNTKCSCLIKVKLPFIDEIKFDKMKLLKSFIDIDNFLNYKFMKCYKNILTKDEIKNNAAFYIEILIFSSYIISLFLFLFKYYAILLSKLSKIIELNKLENTTKNKNNPNKKRNPDKSKNIKSHKSENKLPLIENNEIKRNKSRIKDKINTLSLNSNNKINFLKENKVNINEDLQNSPHSKNIKVELKKNRKLEIKNKINKNKHLSSLKTKKKNNLQTSDDNNNKDSFEYNDNELNSLSYEKALKYDKRTYCEYYISLLRVKQLLFFSFYTSDNDYNSPVIKIFLFFLFFNNYLVVNALFFNDGTIHEIYIDNGEYNFIYQIPQILYSTILSSLINFIIKLLALTKNNKIKSEDSNIRILNVKILENKLKIKFTLFFIFAFILLSFFSYYIICFCGIYSKTQIHLIKDTIVSFILSLIYPFGTNLIPGIFRIYSLNAKKKNKKYMFLISKFFQII